MMQYREGSVWIRRNTFPTHRMSRERISRDHPPWRIKNWRSVIFFQPSEIQNGNPCLGDKTGRHAMKTHLWPITVALLLAVSTGAAERPFAMQSRNAAPPISKATPKSSSAPAVVPYTIHVPDAVLADLKSRLAHARLGGRLSGAGGGHGVEPGYLQGT